MTEAGEQLALLRTRVRPAPKPKAPPEPAPERPVARVAIDVSLPHLDRPFDYLVPDKLHQACVPGCRVKVRFAGQEVDGFVLDRVDGSEHQGKLAPLKKVVSSEPVLAADVAELARAVADRYAGTLADVLRLAVPPRHARVEKETPAVAEGEADPPEIAVPASDRWAAYEHGAAYLEALGRGEDPRAVWTAAPGEDWPACLAVAAAATMASGRGVLLVVPDRRDVARVDEALRAELGEGRHTVLIAELGPAERYRRFLAIRRGQTRCVVGTRAAAFAPVADLGLVACWDDGDDLHAEPRAPYPQVREVLLLRSQTGPAAVLVGGFACTAEGAQLLATGYAEPLTTPRDRLREIAPRVVVTGDADSELARDSAARAARIPHRAFEIARAGLADGPVLVQVPRRGYAPALSCQSCRRSARCGTCSGPMQIEVSGGPPGCRWCARLAPRWRCPHCGGGELRAPVVGAARTAEELGRAFPQVPVRASGGSKVLERVDPTPALVVATPGAEPVAEQGYAAAMLLDSWLLLGRADLRAGEEALRRWMAVAAMVRPGRDGGAVALMAEAETPAVQALVRWGPLWHAERELADRRTAGFPPVARLATVEGGRGAVEELARLAELPDTVEVLGPVPIGNERSRPVGADDEEEQVRLVLRVHRRDGAAMAAALHAAQGVRSARKAPGTVRIQVDSRDLA